MKDNFEESDMTKRPMGPYTVRDNLSVNLPKPQPEETSNSYVKFSSSSGIGPFTRIDNSKAVNTKLIDYIKEINAKESMKDFYNRRKLRSFEREDNSQKFQRRMLYYPGKIYNCFNFLQQNLYCLNFRKSIHIEELECNIYRIYYISNFLLKSNPETSFITALIANSTS